MLGLTISKSSRLTGINFLLIWYFLFLLDLTHSGLLSYVRSNLVKLYIISLSGNFASLPCRIFVIKSFGFRADSKIQLLFQESISQTCVAGRLGLLASPCRHTSRPALFFSYPAFLTLKYCRHFPHIGLWGIATLVLSYWNLSFRILAL